MFEGITSFNGKNVIAKTVTGWGEPSETQLDFIEDFMELTVGNPAHWGVKTQYDQIANMYRILEFDDDGNIADNDIARNYWNNIKSLFDENGWITFGNDFDVVRIVLGYVSYNEANAEEDSLRLNVLREEVTNLLDQVQKHSLDGAVSLSIIATEIYDAYNSVQNKSEEAATITQRLDVFNSLQAGEDLGVGWTNETFWANYGETEIGKKIKQMLAT